MAIIGTLADRRGGKQMTGAIIKETIRVNDTPHDITVHHQSRIVWLAVGDYRGEQIEVKGSSLREAARLWVAAARYAAR